MEIKTFSKGKKIQEELDVLKSAIRSMFTFDDCGMSHVFDINGLPNNIKQKIKPIFSERIEELEEEFKKL